MTSGLFNISTGTVSGFELGPISSEKLDGILDKFDLNFASLTAEFKAYCKCICACRVSRVLSLCRMFARTHTRLNARTHSLTLTLFHTHTHTCTDDSFKEDIINGSSTEFQDLIALKPPSLPRFSSLLQIGSKKPSPQYSDALREKLWNKVIGKFPSRSFNGVQIPGLPPGQNFSGPFTSETFPIQDFIPVIAVAYDIAPSFSDPRALEFSIDDLFAPSFGPGLSTKLLDSLKNAPSLSGIFDRFNETDGVTGLPMDPSTFEIFDVSIYLSEIQVALNLAPSVDLAASGFSAKDISEALFPDPVPTIKSFAVFIKNELVPKIIAALDFGVEVEGLPGGLSFDTPTLDGNGTNLGAFDPGSTRLFPPSVSVDNLRVSLVVSASVSTQFASFCFSPAAPVFSLLPLTS